MMKSSIKQIVFGLFFLLLTSCNENVKTTKVVNITKEESLRKNLIIDSLSVLHTVLGEPKSTDWLANHQESGQTYANYRNYPPTTATPERTILYIAQLNDMDSLELDLLNLTASYLSIFYQCPTKVIQLLTDSSKIPSKYYRKNDRNEKQILTDFYLKEQLLRQIPEDAIGLIGCTTYDIFPDPKWSFVYGKASLTKRVGVWSMRRLGLPKLNLDYLNKIKLRNLKTACHETGHMFSLKHCISYDCLMNGSSHLLESDKRPVYFCPKCLSKLDWNRKVNLQKRFKELYQFWKKMNLVFITIIMK